MLTFNQRLHNIRSGILKCRVNQAREQALWQLALTWAVWGGEDWFLLKLQRFVYGNTVFKNHSSIPGFMQVELLPLIYIMIMMGNSNMK